MFTPKKLIFDLSISAVPFVQSIALAFILVVEVIY